MMFNDEKKSAEGRNPGAIELGSEQELISNTPTPTNRQAIRAELIGASLKWKRVKAGWRLFDGKRRFGDVVPDSKHPGMWRIVLHDGRLSDMANLSWARNAVLEAATRELAFEHHQQAARQPSFTREIRGVFRGRRSLVSSSDGSGT